MSPIKRDIDNVAYILCFLREAIGQSTDFQKSDIVAIGPFIALTEIWMPSSQVFWPPALPSVLSTWAFLSQFGNLRGPIFNSHSVVHLSSPFLPPKVSTASVHSFHLQVCFIALTKLNGLIFSPEQTRLLCSMKLNWDTVCLPYGFGWLGVSNLFKYASALRL